jgi:small GTP-binding protein
MVCFKIVVVGDLGVGKSAFVIKFVQGNFVENFEPQMEDSHRIQIQVNAKTCFLEILDTYDEEDRLGGRYLCSAQAVIFTYSITDEKSFLNVENRVNYFFNSSDNEDCFFFIVGLKCDLENQRKVSFEAGKEISEKLKAKGFFEASAKNEINVQEVFMEAANFLMVKEKLIQEKKKVTCLLM